MSGIKTLADLHARCRINAETGCWTMPRPKGNGVIHCVWSPDLRKRLSIGGLICFLVTGQAPDPKRPWHCTCATEHCANPRHRVEGTRSSQMASAKIKRSLVTRAKIARAKRAKSALSDEAVAAIRAADGSLAEIAAA